VTRPDENKTVESAELLGLWGGGGGEKSQHNREAVTGVATKRADARSKQ